jgi:hypothetical protein
MKILFPMAMLLCISQPSFAQIKPFTKAFVQMDEPLITDISFNKLTTDENAQNVIFVNHQATTNAVAMLESHYFFKKSLITASPSMDWGHGPFFAISLLSEESLDL